MLEEHFESPTNSSVLRNQEEEFRQRYLVVSIVLVNSNRMLTSSSSVLKIGLQIWEGEGTSAATKIRSARRVMAISRCSIRIPKR